MNKTKISSSTKTIIIIGILIALIILLLFFSFINYLEEERNLRLCKTLNGEQFIYSLDQSSFLCKLKDGRIINLDSGLEFNP